MTTPLRNINRQIPLWSPEVKARLLASRSVEINAFAQSYQLDPSLITSIAENAIRLGYVPDPMLYYGLDGIQAAALTDFLNDAFLNTEEKASVPDAILDERNDPLSSARRAADADPDDEGAQGRLMANQVRLNQASGDLDLGERVTDDLGDLILATHKKIRDPNKQPLGDLYHEIQADPVRLLRRQARSGDSGVTAFQHPSLPTNGLMLSNGPLSLPGGFTQAVERLLGLEQGAPFSHQFFIPRLDLIEDDIATQHGNFRYDTHAENIHGRLGRGQDGTYVVIITNVESVNIVWSDNDRNESAPPVQHEATDPRDSSYIQGKINANYALKVLADRHLDKDLKMGRAYFTDNIRPGLLKQREESRQREEITQIGINLLGKQFWQESDTKTRIQVGYRDNRDKTKWSAVMENLSKVYAQAGYKAAWAKGRSQDTAFYVSFDQKKIKATMAVADDYLDILDDIALERMNAQEREEIMRDELYTDDDRPTSYEPRDEDASLPRSPLTAFTSAFNKLLATSEDRRRADARNTKPVITRSPLKTGQTTAPIQERARHRNIKDQVWTLDKLAKPKH